MAELERELRALAAQVDYPPAPDLAARVGARLRARPAPPPRLPFGRAVAVGALTVVVAFAAVATASRQAADALLDAYGLSGVRIERTTAPPPAPVHRSLDLGEPVTLREAAAALSFAPLAPRIFGGPDEVYVRRSTPGGELSLVYEPRRGLPPSATTGTGLLVTEFRGDLLPEYLIKVASQAATVEPLRIDGDQAAWISGAPHFFFFGGPGGIVTDSELLVAQNVLLVQRGGVLVRMEGAFDRATALRLAGTLAPPGA
jgi:hypothetical protein